MEQKNKLTNLYESYYSIYREELNYTIVFNHCGKVDDELILALALRLDGDVLKYGDKKAVIRRLFSILVEGVQNILLSGDLRQESSTDSFIILAKNPMNYKLILGGFIKPESKNTAINFIGNLNNHDEVELNRLYNKYLKEGLLLTESHSGLGFVAMRKHSKNPIEYSIFFPSDEPILVVELQINRNK